MLSATMKGAARCCRMPAVIRHRYVNIATLSSVSQRNCFFHGRRDHATAISDDDTRVNSVDETDQSREVSEIFRNNEKWRTDIVQKSPRYFESMAKGQTPRYLWIGCSDSRVPAETVCGLPPGTLFVHRNIANLVNNVDVSAMSVIQFAVSVLKVQHIVICGHYNCGGVAASMANVNHNSPLENWLRNIRDVSRLHRHELEDIVDKEERFDRLVELNVIEQAINLYKTHVVQKRRVETMQKIDEYGYVQPRIHPVVYDPATGKLETLNFDMQECLKDILPIYNLYTTHDVSDDLGDAAWSSDQVKGK